MLTIVNYGVGNLGSISNMLRYLNVEHQITHQADVLVKAERLLLPGVGAFDYCMAKLQDSGLVDSLNQRVLQDKVPTLGICVGMQAMCKGSEEGQLPGLGWFDAQVKRFVLDKMDQPRPIPHMGWNTIQVRKSHPVLDALPQPSRFYFVHSYHAVCEKHEDEAVSARYGYDFTVGLSRDNILAVQFHPEKSHQFGLALLSQFAKWSYVPT